MFDNLNGLMNIGGALGSTSTATQAIQGMSTSNSGLDQTGSQTLTEMSGMMKSQQAFQTKMANLQTQGAMFNAAMELLKSLIERIERSGR